MASTSDSDFDLKGCCLNLFFTIMLFPWIKNFAPHQFDTVQLHKALGTTKLFAFETYQVAPDSLQPCS